MPRPARRIVTVHLKELVLAARLAGGSLQDNPLIGRGFGTAAALETLRALRH